MSGGKVFGCFFVLRKGNKEKEDKKKKKEEMKKSWSGSQGGHTKKCFCTDGSVQATAQHRHRQQKMGLPQGGTAAEQLVS